MSNRHRVCLGQVTELYKYSYFLEAVVTGKKGILGQSSSSVHRSSPLVHYSPVSDCIARLPYKVRCYIGRSKPTHTGEGEGEFLKVEVAIKEA